jgi:hypothetical protein
VIAKRKGVPATKRREFARFDRPVLMALSGADGALLKERACFLVPFAAVLRGSQPAGRPRVAARNQCPELGSKITIYCVISRAYPSYWAALEQMKVPYYQLLSPFTRHLRLAYAF